MIRLLLSLVILAALCALAAWMADHPGHISLYWEGWRIDTSAALLALAIALFCVICALVIGILRALLRLPHRHRKWKHLRRAHQSLNAVTHSLIALAASDLPSARKHAARVQVLQPGEPISLLLAAQLAKAEGNDFRTRSVLDSMLAHDSTRFLAARSLSDYHLKRAETEDALHYAKTAQDARPDNAAALRLTVESLLRMNQPEQALAAIAASRWKIGRHTRKRLKALVHLTSMGQADELAASHAAQKAASLVSAVPESTALLTRFFLKRGMARDARRVTQHAERHGVSALAGYECTRCARHAERWSPACPQCGALDTLRPA